MTNQEITNHVRTILPPALKTLNGDVLEFDQNAKSIRLSFDVGLQFCHSENIVQGGFISGMLDGAMAFALIGLPNVCRMVATLEIKTSFISPGINGEFLAIGSVVHHGRSIGYLNGRLFQNDNLVATSTSTVKLIK